MKIILRSLTVLTYSPFIQKGILESEDWSSISKPSSDLMILFKPHSLVFKFSQLTIPSTKSSIPSIYTPVFMYSFLILTLSVLLFGGGGGGQENSQTTSTLDPLARQVASARNGELTGHQSQSLISSNNFVGFVCRLVRFFSWLRILPSTSRYIHLPNQTWRDLLFCFFGRGSDRRVFSKPYTTLTSPTFNYRLTFVFLKPLLDPNWWTELNLRITTLVTEFQWEWYVPSFLFFYIFYFIYTDQEDGLFV